MGRVFYSHITENGIDNILESLKNKKSYKCVIPYTDKTTELLTSRVLFTLLSNVFQERLHQNIEYMLNELVLNSCKANAKRVYFDKRNLNINNSDDYNRGMKDFFTEVYNSKSNFREELKNRGYYVKISFEIAESCLEIIIENNSGFVPQEKKLIERSLEIAHKFKSLNDVFTNSFNTFEGVGYGLILIILMLKKINVDPKALDYSSQNGVTTTALRIPLNLISDEQGTEIAEEIIKEIDKLPQFPDSILRLQKELKDPECNFTRISDFVISDSPLSAEVLRIANSPVYLSKGKIEKISEAVKRIGIKGLNSILYSFGAIRVLDKNFNIENINIIKEHLFNVAIIASYLASYKKLNNFAEDIFVAALLHDIGKIIVNSLNKKLCEDINRLCIEKSIPTSVLDDLTNGYNHTVIGSELAKKWNFPQKYINAIKYHHNPEEDDSYYKTITYCVYMGNQLNHYLNSGRKMNQIDYNILKFFNLETSEKFDIFIDDMKREGLTY